LPIIGKVGRRSLKVRILSTAIHIVLLLGTVTMIYPFTMMVSASFKSHVDSVKFSVYPKFFFDDEILFRKYVEARYNEESNQMIENYKGRFISFEQVEIPVDTNRLLYEDWQEFLENYKTEHDLFDYYISEQFGRGIYPRNERIFRQKIKQESNEDLEVFNDRYNTSILSWEEVRVEERDILSRNFTGDYRGFLKRYEEFRPTLPLWNRVYCTLDGNFIKNELMPAYRSNLVLLNQQLGTDFNSWQEIKLNSYYVDNELKEHWENYVRNQLNITHVQILPGAEEYYRNFLQQKYDDVGLLNRTYKTSFSTFDDIRLPEKMSRSGASLVDWIFFIENIVPVEFLSIKSVELDYRNWLRGKYNFISELNSSYDKGYEVLTEVPLPEKIPGNNLALQKDWTEFVREQSYSGSIALLMTCQAEYVEFLTGKFPAAGGELDLKEYNSVRASDFTKLMNIYPAEKLPEKAEYRSLWLEFVEDHVSGRFLTISAEKETSNWHNYLLEKYPAASDLNNSYHLVYNDFSEIEVDNYKIDYLIFKEHKSDIFQEFIKRNYVMVLDLMLYNGRAIINTLIYCLLAIVTALIINPLAAYAMSRYKLRSTYKILLILMLTMAFPPMVMGIPNFLLLKRLNLLNTFWALILPAAADGYFIFLLKGFFDSLPKELFESATIDGAGEGRIFWQIALSLSKPIMAVIALGAFNAAYRNFMFAFIVCQDKSMWTMMVHIYQLIQRSAPGVGFAALVIAAIPTFAVFVFFQNIIIRGIVVPTEK
jgi:ABC-type glycerol-3-phosphate transport system permease component